LSKIFFSFTIETLFFNSKKTENMKIIYTLFAFLFTCGLAASAQNISGNTKAYPISLQQLQEMKAQRLPKLNNTDRNIYQVYVDYGAASFDANAYIIDYNSKFTTADSTSSEMNYEGVVIKNIAGYTDPYDVVNSYTDWNILGLSDSFPSNIQITIDSIYSWIGHENNSAHLDTIVMSLSKALSNGNPSTSTANVVWSQRDSFDYTLSVDGTWIGMGAILGWGPEYVNAPGQKLTASISYYNADRQDTFGVVGTCIDADLNGAAESPSLFNTSYTRLAYLGNTIYPNVGLGFDNNGDGALDEWFAAQNWQTWFLVTIDDVLGVNDNFDNLIVHYITPNPASSNANIWFGLKSASDVTINLLDMSGKYIKTIKAGNYAAGSFYENFDVSDVNSGMYLVSVQAGNNTPVVSKLMVSK
jgi:hypothetical protein